MSCDVCWFGDVGDPLVAAEPLGVDANGVPTASMRVGGREVIVHYVDDIPDSDITTVDGIRCTTALRTLIDIAVDRGDARVAEILDDCLRRRLFTVEEAWDRIAQPDLADHPGARLLGRALSARLG